MWSWWGSLEAVEHFSFWMFIVLCIGLVLGAVGTISTRLAGWQVDRLKAQRAAAQQAAQQAEFDQKLAELSVISQQITQLESGNAIVLDDEPDPQSVHIFVGPLRHLPQERYGYRMEGRQIFITHPQTLAQVQQ